MLYGSKICKSNAFNVIRKMILLFLIELVTFKMETKKTIIIKIWTPHVAFSRYRKTKRKSSVSLMLKQSIRQKVR